MDPEPDPEPSPPPPLEELSLRRLLVAIDGSPNSELALWAAVRAAKLDNAAITLMTVEPDVGTDPYRWSAPGGPSPSVLQEEASAEAERTLRDAVARIPAEVPVTTVHRIGRAGPEIVAQSEADNYDAVLLGARGVGRVAALLGSVSQYVMHHASIHVIVARN